MADHSKAHSRPASIDDANTALAVACTKGERLAACEQLIVAAQREADRLRYAIDVASHAGVHKVRTELVVPLKALPPSTWAVL